MGFKIINLVVKKRYSFIGSGLVPKVLSLGPASIVVIGVSIIEAP